MHDDMTDLPTLTVQTLEQQYDAASVAAAHHDAGAMVYGGACLAFLFAALFIALGAPALFLLVAGAITALIGGHHRGRHKAAVAEMDSVEALLGYEDPA